MTTHEKNRGNPVAGKKNSLSEPDNHLYNYISISHAQATSFLPLISNQEQWSVSIVKYCAAISNACQLKLIIHQFAEMNCLQTKFMIRGCKNHFKNTMNIRQE